MIQMRTLLLKNCSRIPRPISAAPIGTLYNLNYSTDKNKAPSERKKLVEYLENWSLNPVKKKTAELTNELKYYDPPYLDKEKPFPNYPELLINLKSNDYIRLNVFYKFVEKMCNALNVETSIFEVPARSYNIKTYQPYTTNIDKEYLLFNYHRCITLKGVTSVKAPYIFEAIQLNLPQAVNMSVTLPDPDIDEFRYVPDIQLNELKAIVEEMTYKTRYELEQAEAEQKARDEAAAKAKAKAAKAKAEKAELEAKAKADKAAAIAAAQAAAAEPK
jgi:hypothetical protein